MTTVKNLLYRVDRVLIRSGVLDRDSQSQLGVDEEHPPVMAQDEALLKQMVTESKYLELTVNNINDSVINIQTRIAKLREKMNTSSDEDEKTRVLSEIQNYNTDIAALYDQRTNVINKLKEIKGKIDEIKTRQPGLMTVESGEQNTRMKMIDDQIKQMRERISVLKERIKKEKIREGMDDRDILSLLLASLSKNNTGRLPASGMDSKGPDGDINDIIQSSIRKDSGDPIENLPEGLRSLYSQIRLCNTQLAQLYDRKANTEDEMKKTKQRNPPP